MRARNSVFAELESAIKCGSREKRIESLRRITDLFLSDVDRFNEEQISVFDDVLCHLIKRIETKALAELSARLAPIDNAPIEVVRKLARNDNIVVAAPVLTQSGRLTKNDLIEISQTKSQAHLLAISGRANLEEVVINIAEAMGSCSACAIRSAAQNDKCAVSSATIMISLGP